MKKGCFFKILFLMLFLLVVPTNVFAVDSLEYYDGIFASNQFVLNTDLEISNDESLTSYVMIALSNYSIYESNGSSNYSSWSLSLSPSVSSCSYDNMSCDFSLYHNVSENGNYTSEFIKNYENVSIVVNSNISDNFEMLDGNNIVINYDDSMFSSNSERENYISNYLNSFYVSDGNSSISYHYISYVNCISRIESFNSRPNSVVLKKIDNVIFDYSEEPFSDDFKRLTSGTLTIKTDSDITVDMLSSYLSSVYSGGDSFSIDGRITNNKVFIKMGSYGDNGYVLKEKHLITLVKDTNIDVSLFAAVGYGESANIPIDPPANARQLIMDYFNLTSFNISYDDNSYASYDELVDYNSNNLDYVTIKYCMRTNGVTTDVQFHQVPIQFSGYSDSYSEQYMNKVGNEIVINADSLSLETINNNMHYDSRALQCNSDFSVCDIAYRDYANNTIEIHRVNIVLNNEISEEFMNSFGINSDRTINIIMDSGIEFSYGSLYYYYYDYNNSNSLSFQCNNSKCRLSLSNYDKNKYETHEFNYNIVSASPSASYLSLVNNSIDVYPGETQNIYNRIRNSYSAFSKTGYSSNVKVNSCDSSINKCSIIAFNSDKVLEIHNSTVNIKDGRSPEFDALFPGDTISINSVYKDDPDYISNVSMAYLMSKTKTWSYLKDFSDGRAVISFNDFETHTMNVEFADGNSKHQKEVDKVIQKIGDREILINLDDLDFINNFYYSDGESESSNYNSKKLNDVLNKLINNKHISYFFVEQGGMGNQFLGVYGGKALLFYDGVAYGVSDADITTVMRKIIYIPDETSDTPEAYVKAVQARIDSYLGKNSGVVVNYVEPYDNQVVSDILNDEYLDVSDFDGNCYTLSYKDRSVNIIVVKDSSKMQSSTFTAFDVNNNVIVSSDNANYPTNTVVSSEKFDSVQYKQLLDRLGLSSAEIIDINLYSPTIGSINQFLGVDFDVSVPIDLSKFKSKKLYAYYISDDGKIEEYPISMDDFMANFKTTHFSTYIISEKVDDSIDVITSNVANPRTFDDVMFWFILGGVSLVGLSCFFIYKKREYVLEK